MKARSVAVCVLILAAIAGQAFGQQRTQLVVITTDGDQGSKDFQTDYRAGYFSSYEVMFLHYDRASNSWSNPALLAEFQEACKPPRIDAPTIWIRGTPHYRVGYTPEMRTGLLGWLARLAKAIVEGIIGRPDPRLVLPLATTPVAPYQRSPESKAAETTASAEAPKPKDEIDWLLREIVDLKRQLSATGDHVRQFQEAGVIGKVKLIGTLKGDAEQLKGSVSELKSHVQDVRQRTKEHPWQTLWGLIGLLTGALHRRFDQQKDA